MKKFLHFCFVILVLLLVGIALLVPGRMVKAQFASGETLPTAPAEVPTTEPLTEAPTEVPTEAPTEPAAVYTFTRQLPPLETYVVPSEQGPHVTYRVLDETAYTVGILDIRSGPGSAFPVIGTLDPNTPVHRIAIGDNGWSRFTVNGQEAYAPSIYLSVVPVVVQDLQEDNVVYTPTEDLVFATSTIKLRTGPGSHFAVAGHLVGGDGAIRISSGSNGWSKLRFHDTVVYAATPYLSTSKHRDLENPTYLPVDETVYATDLVNIRSGPGTDSEALGQLPAGQAVRRTAIGDNGWSQVELDGNTVYIYSAYLAERLPDPIVTGEPERPTPNSPFVYQYVAPENQFPHAFFKPVNADPNTPLPLIISLHGALEIGEGRNTLEANFLTKEFRNWEYTGLSGFDAYVVCPQLTGYGYSESWCTPESADKLFSLIDWLCENYNIDRSHISLEGHSLGGQGVFYMAADERACFSAIVPVSAYHPGVPYDHISTQVRGYTGSPYIPAPREDRTSYHFMAEAFSEVFGLQNWVQKSCSHYDIPMVALEEDADGNGRSDLIDWMITQ